MRIKPYLNMRVPQTLIVLLLALSCSPSLAEAIKVMTLNVAQESLTDDPNAPYYGGTPPWDYRKDELYHIINSTSPDVLALQEDSTRQKNDIYNKFSNVYGRADTVGHYYPGDDVFPAARNHHTIFFRKTMFTLLEQGSFPTLIERRGWWAKLRKIDTETEFYVFNIHWHGVYSDGTYDVQLFNNTEEAIWSTAGNTPFILLGDFNVTAYVDGGITGDHLDGLLSQAGKYGKYNYHSNHSALNISLETIVSYLNGSIGSNDYWTTWDQWAIDHILTTQDIKRNGLHSHYTEKVYDAPPEFHSPYATDHPAAMVNLTLPGEPPANMVPIHYLLLLDEND